MNSSHELAKIWHFLKEREIRLIELTRQLSALLEVLRMESRFFDSYRTTYEQLGQSNAVLQEGQTLQAIDEKLHELSASEWRHSLAEHIDANDLALRHVDPEERFELDRFEHQYEAELACGLLHANGIPCELSSEVLPGLPGKIILWTRAKDADLAWALLSDAERESSRGKWPVGLEVTMTNNEGTERNVPQPDGQHELTADRDQTVGSTKPQRSSVTEDVHPSEIESPKSSDGDDDRLALLDRLARLQAEVSNWRKRAEREQAEFKEYALAESIKSLLPILDSLDRAVNTPALNVQEYRAGIDLIRKQFEALLGNLGVNQIPAAGADFDPRRHEAIEVVDTTSAADNQVLEELQRGYMLRDRLLRPTLVRVARKVKPDAQRDAA
jgi:molecular chaperone GrpE